MSDVEWTNDAAIHLIQEYAKRPELWDTNHSLYRVHTAKYEAWSDMARIFECDMTDLRKKLNSIFASHRREKAKVRCGGRSSWFLYPYMKFLPSHVENNNDVVTTPKADTRHSQSQESEQTSSDDDDDNRDETIIIKAEPEEPQPKKRVAAQSTSKPRLTKPIKRRVVRDFSTITSHLDSKLIEALKLLKRSDLSRKKDECDSFGEYIATSLRKHDERTQSMIKQAINNILFEQEMKKYSGAQYTVVLTNMEENPLVLGEHETDK